MEIFAVFFILLGVFASLNVVKSNFEHTSPFIFLLFFGLIFGLLMNSGSIPIKFGLLFFGMLIGSFVIFPIAKTKPKLLFLASGLICLLPFVLLNQQFEFFQYPVRFILSEVLLLPVIAWIAVQFIGRVAPLIMKKFVCDEHGNLESILLLAVIGVMAQIGFFFGHRFGIVLIGLGSLAAIQGGAVKNVNFAYTLIAALVLFIPFDLAFLNQNSVSLAISGRFLLAIFLALALTLAYIHAERLKLLSSGLLILFYVIAICGFAAMGLYKEDFGGMSYLYLFGLVTIIAAPILQKSIAYSLIPHVSIVFGLMIMSFNLFKPKEIVGVNSKNPTAVVMEIVKKPTYESFAILPFTETGKFEIVSDSSKIDFELGIEPSITRGEFTKWNGSFVFENEKLVISIKLPMTGMTTNIAERDASISGKGWFDKLKTPIITYDASLEKQVDGSFKGSGIMLMAGFKKTINVQMKQTELKNGMHVFRAKLEVDRTKFGMISDAKIGDNVKVDVIAFCKK